MSLPEEQAHEQTPSSTCHSEEPRYEGRIIDIDVIVHMRKLEVDREVELAATITGIA